MLCQRYIDVIDDNLVGRQSGTIELDSINVGIDGEVLRGITTISRVLSKRADCIVIRTTIA